MPERECLGVTVMLSILLLLFLKIYIKSETRKHCCYWIDSHKIDCNILINRVENEHKISESKEAINTLDRSCFRISDKWIILNFLGTDATFYDPFYWANFLIIHLSFRLTIN